MSKKLTTEEFIKKSEQIHGNKYIYEKINYVNSHTKVCIICPEHGEFWQMPYSHLNGIGCKKCGIKNGASLRTSTTKDFVEKANSVHKDKYIYDKVEYVNKEIKVCIICPEHGEFWQTPHNHLSGYGCPECKKYILRKIRSGSLNEFIEKATQIHGDKYDYSRVNYINNHTKVEIICPKHGSFWQTPNDHLDGKGCNKCNLSKGEERIKRFLDDNKINYIYNKACLDFLRPLKPDFYLPDYNLVIEYDGEQHFKSIEIFGGKEGLKKRKRLDIIKNKLCEENSVEVFRIKFTEFSSIENILRDKLILEEKNNGRK